MSIRRPLAHVYAQPHQDHWDGGEDDQMALDERLLAHSLDEGQVGHSGRCGSCDAAVYVAG
jgi:hypothetical protein